MSVYPDDSRPVPSGALTPGGVRALQSVTEDSARSEIRSQALMPWQEARGNFFENIIGGIGKAFEDGLRGIVGSLSSVFDPVRRAGETARDGQVEFNDRLDLLSPLLDYCSVSTKPGSGDAIKGTGRMPFTYQIGPRRNVTPVDGMLRLEDRGLWDLRAMVTCSWVLAGGDAQAYLRVLHPDGRTIYSQQAFFMSTLSSHTMTLISSVVVPEPGYFVDVWVAATSTRGWWTGPAWTRLTAQHISRNLSGGTGSEDSAPPSGEPSPPDDGGGYDPSPGPVGSL